MLNRNSYKIVMSLLIALVVLVGVWGLLFYQIRENQAIQMARKTQDVQKYVQFAERNTGAKVLAVHYEYHGRDGFNTILILQNKHGERCSATANTVKVWEMTAMEDEARPIFLPGDTVIISEREGKLVFERQEPDLPPAEKPKKS